MSLDDRVELIREAERLGFRNWKDDNGKEHLELHEVSSVYVAAYHERFQRLTLGMNEFNVVGKIGAAAESRHYAAYVTRQHMKETIDKWHRRGYKKHLMSGEDDDFA